MGKAIFIVIVALLLTPLSPWAQALESGLMAVSLTLDEAVQRALEKNRSIRDYQYAVEDSRIGLGAARDVFDIKIRPLSSINYTSGDESELTVWQVGGELSKKFHTGIDVDLRPSVARGDEEYDAGVGFSIEVPLLKGLGRDVVLNDVYSNEFGVASSLRNLHRQRVNIILETVSGVYRVVKEKQLIDLYHGQLDALRNHLIIASIKEKAGLAKSMDVYRVEIEIKEVEDSLNLSIERQATVIDQLKELLALDMNQELKVQAPLDYSFISVDLDRAVEIALDKRIEIEQGQAGVTEAQRKTILAYHNIRPELNFEASYERKGRAGEFDSLFVFDEDVFSIGLTSNTDFSRSAERSQWAQSKTALNREHLRFATTRETIIREIRRVANALSKSRERIALRREQIVQATGKQRLAQVKFQHGKADNFDLIESQGQLQRARVNLVADEIQYIIDSYRLRAAMGTLLEYNGI